MSSNPLYVSFLWHMHQPYYKNPFTGVYRLPWVRLHGIKDYYDMAAILEDFPSVHQTFNLVPSLIEQILDYTEGGASDNFLEISKVPAEALTEAQKTTMLSDFFYANWDNMIGPLPRYYELLSKRGKTIAKDEFKKAVRYFSTQDFLDLQVLFNLCWFDPIFMEKQPFLKELVSKGRNFTEEEKELLLKMQIDMMKLIIPEYKRMHGKGQIEISTSPFYHPILPLLHNTNSAKVAMPDIKLPQFVFSHPEDAAAQVRMAVEYFEKIFGFKPEGMWPSEGSVSPDILKTIKNEGIKWIATDEGILAASLGIHLRDLSGAVKEPQKLYKPYTVGDGLSIVFRDHTLSDLIGFVYSGWDARKAADNFIDRLYKIKHSLPKDRPFLVSVILDGENAWEYYRNDGRDFLFCLYESLSRADGIKTVTVSEYLREHPPHTQINSLFSGSWIYSNFAIWIGHEEDNLAWDALYEARESLAAHQQLHPEADLKEAWQAIYIAEGSDWCWWYGDEHVTETQEEFDELFRANLMKVYKLIGKEIPPKLSIPILREDRSVKPTVAIRGFITPKIDGEITSYYEWLHSAYMETKKIGGTMHRAEAFISTIFYGFDLNTLYLRTDAANPLIEISKGITFSFHFLKPVQTRLDVIVTDKIKAVLYNRVQNEWKQLQELETVAIADIMEVALPFALLGAKEGDEVAFILSVLKDGSEIERWPWRGCIALEVPGSRFEAMMWQ